MSMFESPDSKRLKREIYDGVEQAPMKPSLLTVGCLFYPSGNACTFKHSLLVSLS